MELTEEEREQLRAIRRRMQRVRDGFGGSAHPHPLLDLAIVLKILARLGLY